MAASYQPYVPSNKTGRAWMLPLIGIAAAALTAFLYAWINVYSPIAGYVSILFVIGLALGAAYPIAIAGRILKVRNPMILRLNGVVTGVMAIYFAWAFFAWVLLYKSDAEEMPTMWQLIHSPAALWSFANFLAEEGWYSIRSATPKGIVLWIFWAIEAAVVIGGCVFLSTRQTDGLGFCEDCDRWLDAEDSVGIPDDTGAPKKQFHRGGLEAITEVTAPRAGAARWMNIGRQRCLGCRKTALFRLDEMSVVQTKEGQKVVATPILPWSLQGPAEAASIERIEGLLKAADEQHLADVEAEKAAAKGAEA